MTNRLNWGAYTDSALRDHLSVIQSPSIKATSCSCATTQNCSRLLCSNYVFLTLAIAGSLIKSLSSSPSYCLMIPSLPHHLSRVLAGRPQHLHAISLSFARVVMIASIRITRDVAT